MASNRKSLETSGEMPADERLGQKLILSCQIVLYVERVMNTSLAIPEE